MLRPSPNHGTQQLPNDDSLYMYNNIKRYASRYMVNIWCIHKIRSSSACIRTIRYVLNKGHVSAFFLGPSITLVHFCHPITLLSYADKEEEENVI